MGTEPDPPDQNGQTLASLVRGKATPVNQELADSALEFCGKIRMRYYYIGSRINRKMLAQVFNEKFKSLAYENYAFYEAEGVRFIVLHAGFFENSPSFNEDFQNSSTVKFKNLLVHAVPDDELVEGTFVPKPEKKILISGLNLAQLADRECLAQGFSGVLELHENLKLKLLGDPTTGKFSGEAVLRVKNFLKLPAREFDFPISADGSFQRITTKSFGYPKNLAQDFKGHKCYRCNQIGHMAIACPTKPNTFSWKCTVCGFDSLGCTALVTVGGRVLGKGCMKAEFLEAWPEWVVRKPQDYYTLAKKNLPAVKPTLEQGLLAISNSKRICEAVCQQQVEGACEAIEDWVTIKIGMHNAVKNKNVKVTRRSSSSSMT